MFSTYLYVLTAESTGGGLFTVTLTGAEGVLLPAASRATAVRVCVPLRAVVLFQETVYGATVTSAPRLAPSSLNCTPPTPTLSEAIAEIVTTLDTVAPLSGDVIETSGGVASPFTTVTLTPAEAVLLPAASRATAVRMCVPLRAVGVVQETL